ncbi:MULTISPECIES: YheC/YheD family endospore coat-associated protein [Paenibacillus]|jgi:hypothetical protein|uniref:YheC/YheD family endospore coat-associated protein n=1 Tax=Paenibacillus TaxID=44249 RepID=UPI00096D1DE7|nr:YheC/YheD family protein [Paenibacillus odorifer]OMC75509.1 hypothetical protein BK121_05915 [Paenibacillus odorifer]OME04059.1 hypothetical protein BSK54_04685 [Paenibacillus odorifer]OME08468.1 hypothetical protein BSK64_03910 [Paenibacillus odorifer]
MTETEVGFLGIMTGRRNGNPPIAEPEFCSHLCRAAPLYSLKVLVFHPDGVAADGSSITGYTWKDGSWQNTTSSPPDIVYNRCFYEGPKERKEASAALSTLHRSLPWSRGLPDKWGVHEILKRDRRAAAILPETVLYTGTRRLSTMLAEREYGVFLKPKAGTHGKRTLHAILQNRGMRVRGRDGTNTPFQYVFDSQAEGLNWIHEFIGSRRYIIQPFLHLTNSKGQPFDVRVLMQKNGLGRWTLTGMAVRLGNQGSLTSNLHGGGTAVSPLPFLLAEYGQGGKDIMRELAAEGAYLPPLLEAACGRLGELGLDFGIDSSGRIHLLEANSKPGRTVFRLTGDRRAAKLAAENPLSYARHLLLTQRRIPSLSTGSSVTNGRMITMVPKEDS